MMGDFLTSRVEFRRWLDQMVVDAQDREKLGLELPTVILARQGS